MSKATEKITITRALATLKLLDKRISKAIANGQFANYTQGGKPFLEDYTPKADLQSVQDLIEYRAKLKSGIMSSNAQTIVKIGGKKMTVVEAIETKDSIKYKKELLRKLKTDLRNTDNVVDNINRDVQERLDSMIRSSFGGEQKVTSKDYDAISGPFLKQNEAKNVDSKVYKKIAEELETEIDDFESEVDLVLSESNSITLIEV